MQTQKIKSHPVQVGVYLSTANRISYLIVKTLAMAGCRVHLHSDVTAADIERQKAEPGNIERNYFSWLFSEDNVALVTPKTQLPELDVVIWEMGPKRLKFPELLSSFCAKTKVINGWDPSTQEQSWRFNQKSDAAALVRGFPFSIKCHRVVVGGGRLWLRLISLLRPTHRQGYFINPHFLRDSGLMGAMFANDWTPQENRPWRLLFSGNPEPEARRNIVTEVQAFLLASQNVNLERHFSDIRDATNNRLKVLWMVRADPNDPQWAMRADVIPPLKWPGLLSRADFSLCPPGYENKTHRVVESLIRGAIPILDCPEEYDLELKDGVNCLVVKNGDWEQQVQRALSLEQSDIQTMRCSIQVLREKYLTCEAMGQHWLRKCGLPVEQ